MKIYYSPKFAREFSSLHKKVKFVAEQQEALFRQDPFNPKLKTHKLKGKLKGFLSFSIAYKYRIIFEFDDDVPVSGLDSGFLAMAVNGHKAGIVKDKAGLLFVGANELNYESLGLRAEVKEDRGRQVTFYVDEEGNDVVKKLYPGFAIVLNGDLEVAKKLARSGMKKAE